METCQQQPAQSSLEDIKNIIRTYRSIGHFAEAAKFIGELPKDVVGERLVAIEAAQLYLTQGQYRLAAEICDNVPGTSSTKIESKSFAFSKQDEVAADFELLRALISQVMKFSKVKAALEIAQQFGSIYNLDKPFVPGAFSEGLQGNESSPSFSKPEGTAQQALEGSISHVSEYRVSMVSLYWKIMIAAAVHGLLDEHATKAAALATISPLRRALQTTNRLQEASSLICFEIQLIKDPEEAIRQLQCLLGILTNDKWDTERALILTELFKLQLQSSDSTILTSAENTFEEAQQLFSKVSHSFGNIDLEFTRISSNRTISAEEKFFQTVGLVERYFQVGHYGQMMLCLVTALSETAIDGYVEQVKYAIELQQQLADEMGSELMQNAALVRAAGSANLNAAEYGFALKGLEPHYTNVTEEIDPNSHSTLAITMSMIYGSFGSNLEALKAAEEGLEVAKAGKSYKACSDAALILGIRHLAISEQYPKKSAEDVKWFSSAMDILKEWIEKDSENNYVDGEIRKCLLVGKWENLRALDNAELKATPIEEPWIRRVKRLLLDGTDLLIQNEVMALEVSMLMRQGNFMESSKLSVEILNDLEKLPFAPPMIKALAYSRTSLQIWHLYQATLNGNSHPSAEERLRATTQLWSAMDLANKSLQQWRITSSSEMIIQSTVALGSLISDVIMTISEDVKRELLNGFLEELRKTATVCDDMRRSVIPIEGLKSLMNKRLLVAKDSSLKIYNSGVRVALHLNDPAEAWIWLQKGKSRAFSDSLGARLLVPQELLQRINGDPAAFNLLQTEQKYLDALNEPGVNYISVSRQLVSVRNRIEEYTPLAEITRIRDGGLKLDLKFDSLDKVLSRTNLSRERVKFVDWYVPSLARKSNTQIICFVRTLDGTTQTKHLSVTVSQVEAWVAKAFTYPDMAEHPLNKKTGNRLLQEMNALVDWLADYSLEGDLLVLSPSAQLISVPLHALFIQKRSLVERNLIVYAASAAVISQCLDRSAARRNGEAQNEEETTAFLAVYEEPLRANERSLIFSHIKKLSMALPGKVILGPKVTKSSFLQISSTATWLHYHGHASYCKEDILQSSLILSDGEDVFGNYDMENPRFGRDEVSVVDIFDTTMPQGGVHLTIIACESGAQDLSPGDEPLGIIPALLHAGATSVLGCQWPIKSSAGRAFSETFYDEVKRMRSEIGDHNQAINLARALGITVGKMRRGELGLEYKQAYCWASFAINGLWFFPGSNYAT